MLQWVNTFRLLKNNEQKINEFKTFQHGQTEKNKNCQGKLHPVSKNAIKTTYRPQRKLMFPCFFFAECILKGMKTKRACQF